MAKVHPIPFLGILQSRYVSPNNLIGTNVVNVKINSGLGKAGEVQSQIVQENLSNAGAVEFDDASNELTPYSFSDANLYKIVVPLGKALKENEYNNQVKQIRELGLVTPQVAQYTAEQNQDRLVQAINGAFDTALASTHYDNTQQTYLTYKNIRDLASTFGEKTQATTLIVNQKVYDDMMNRAMVNELNGSLVSAEQYQRDVIRTVAGLRVVINDTLCAYDSANGVYPYYVAGDGALGFEVATNLNIEQDRDVLKNLDYYTMRWRIAPYIEGTSWVDTSTIPTAFSDLATGANWAKPSTVANENIKILKGLSGVETV